MLVLTPVGILTTVVPMQILEFIRLVVTLLIGVLSCCNKETDNTVSDYFDSVTQYLTSLNVNQVQNIKFTQDIVRLTYQDVIWLIFLAIYKWQVDDDSNSNWTLLTTLILTIGSLCSQLI